VLTVITFLPLLGAFLLLLFDARATRTLGLVALTVSGVELLLSLALASGFDAGQTGMQFTDMAPWVPPLGASYHLGVDGLSVFLVVLTTFITLLCTVSAVDGIQHNLKSFLFFLLMLETSVIGVFVSLDLLLFYVFWEFTLIPMYFIIGGWGGTRRIYAAVKFFVYTIAGSLLMLVAIIGVRFAHGGPGTFDIVTIMQSGVQPADQGWLFLAFALAFAVKAPLFPLHTWLPDAYMEAPTAGTVMLAAVLSKLGAYGFLRFCLGLFPDAARDYAGLIGALAVFSILYGAYLAITRPDMKGLVAYSSLGHLGFIVLGVFALNGDGIAGSVIQMVNHGISTALLFFLIGMVYSRWGSRLIGEYSGLHRLAPVMSFMLLIAGLSSISLPGLNGFVGEFLILVGAYRGYPLAIYSVFAAVGVIFAAFYVIWWYRRVFHGELRVPATSNSRASMDLTRRELSIVIPCIVLILWLGVAPGTLLSKVDATAQNWAAPHGRQAVSAQDTSVAVVKSR